MEDTCVLVYRNIQAYPIMKNISKNVKNKNRKVNKEMLRVGMIRVVNRR